MIDVDISDFLDATRKGELSKQELLNIRGAGAKIVINEQRRLVPVDTSATQNSIRSHVTKATRKKVEDEIGPETEYAPVIEYGRRDMPNYPMQPFIRPSASRRNQKMVFKVMGASFRKLVEGKWP